MAGAACAEWHLHAWDLARALGAEHRPADPAVVLAGWQAGMTHLPAAIPGPARRGHPADPWDLVLLASGRAPRLSGAGLPSYAEVDRLGTDLGGFAAMNLDVSAIRAAYPALADGYAYLDGAAGTQVPALGHPGHRRRLRRRAGQFRRRLPGQRAVRRDHRRLPRRGRRADRRRAATA